MSDSHNTIQEKILNFLKEVGSSKLITLLEPEIEKVSSVRIGQSRYICKSLSRLGSDDFLKFPNKYGRNTTIAGIWMFLQKTHRREYLITAFGRRKTKKITGPGQYEGLHINCGYTTHVSFSQKGMNYLNLHSKYVDKSDILIFHNHPDTFLRQILSNLIEWSPLPSNSDREVMYQFKEQSVIQFLTSGKYGNFRFYLVELGRLREFKWPSLEGILRLMGINI